MADKLIVASSPHLRHKEGVQSIMLDVIIALLPLLVVSVYLFGYRALVLTLVSVASCVAFEFLYRKLMKKSINIGDLSAVVTGLLLAFSLPVTMPLWMPVVGAFFAIVIVKELFGGIGKNFVNPALAARIFLFSWPAAMTTWAKPIMEPLTYLGADAVTGATALESLKSGKLPDTSVFDMLLGYRPGSLGETCVLMILVGGLYLLYRRVITWHIPVSFIGTVAVLTYLFPLGGADRVDFMLYQLLAGGLAMGAFFCATDYTTSPITSTGKLIYGFGCGAITVLIRYFGGYPEGVSFAILLMNLLVWYIDKITRPRLFGGGGARA